MAVTCAPLFIDKARLFPGCTFVVGSDTIKRILDKKYYGGTDLVRGVAWRGVAWRQVRAPHVVRIAPCDDSPLATPRPLALSPLIPKPSQHIPLASL